MTSLTNNKALNGVVRGLATRGAVSKQAVREVMLAWALYNESKKAESKAAHLTAKRWDVFEVMFRALNDEDKAVCVALRAAMAAK